MHAHAQMRILMRKHFFVVQDRPRHPLTWLYVPLPHGVVRQRRSSQIVEGRVCELGAVVERQHRNAAHVLESLVSDMVV